MTPIQQGKKDSDMSLTENPDHKRNVTETEILAPTDHWQCEK